MIDFDNLIDNYLKTDTRQKIIGKYYPSEIAGCMRKSWYSYKMPREVHADTLRFFEAGNMVHEFVADVIRSEKNQDIELLATEHPIFITHKDFVISGRMDNIMLVKIESKIYILEIKSTANINYTKEPRNAHIIQLQLYMHSSGLHEGLILYIERNNLKSKVFKIDYNPEIVKETLDRFDNLHNHLKSNNLPLPEARIERIELGWQCDKCQYREECYASNPKSEELP